MIIECVPNFSEGRDLKVVDAIADSIAGVPGVTLLDVDPDYDTHRTVMTYIGAPQAVAEAAFMAARRAATLIDMRRHSGVHPRLGATDVLPLIPIRGVDTATCIALANQIGARLGADLAIPTYLYAQAATAPQRTELAHIRKGEYEGLANKLRQPEWQPDYGPTQVNSRSGATCVGVRPLLVAFNVNLESDDIAIARRLAAAVRESGRLVRHPDGIEERIPGHFKRLKAIGWYLPRRQRVQVSMNLLDYKVSGPRDVYDMLTRLAKENNTRVTGSQLVGMIPKDALTGPIPAAVKYLGLDEFGPFDANRKIFTKHLE